MTASSIRLNSPGAPIGYGFFIFDCTAGNDSHYLPDAAASGLGINTIMKVDGSGNTLAIIDNGITLCTLTTKGETVTLYSDGATWNIGIGLTAIFQRQILDSFGHLLLQFHPGGPNAVNYLQIANAQTGANPELDLQGSDTDVGLNIVPKGAGTVQINGTQVGVASGVVIGHTPGPGGPSAVEYNALVDALKTAKVIS